MRAENTGTGNAAENAQVKDHHQLIGDGYAGYLIRSKLADHDIIQHIDKVGHKQLDNDGYHQSDNHGVKGLVPNKSALKTLRKTQTISSHTRT